MDRSAGNNWGWFKSVGAFFRGGPSRLSLDDFQKAAYATRQLNEWFGAILPLGPQTVSELTYRQAIQYFIEQRPAQGRVVRGAMLSQDHPQGRLLTQVFLDENNDLVADASGKACGRRLVVHRFDSELQRTFGDKDLVIVE